jgi:hypothetical protein
LWYISGRTMDAVERDTSVYTRERSGEWARLKVVWCGECECPSLLPMLVAVRRSWTFVVEQA